MKWLFATLVALNIVVFAGMIAYKLIDKHFAQPTPVAAPANNQQMPAQIIINTGTGGTAIPNATTSGTAAAPNVTTRATAPKTISGGSTPAPSSKQTPARTAAPVGEARAQYRACSARVSMPEDDYHRIKGLLAKFPHAATRQVVENPAEGEAQTASRMNILFMQVNDQDASTIQGIVGRYGNLNRAACNK